MNRDRAAALLRTATDAGASTVSGRNNLVTTIDRDLSTRIIIPATDAVA